MTIRWGVVGAGRIAGRFVTDARANGITVDAVASRDSARAQAFADRHGLPRAHGGYDHLFASDVDAIYIATPQPFHAEQACAALVAGKAVLVEKSFTATSVEAQSVIAEAGRLGRFVMEAMWMRFQPSVRDLVRVVERGDIGAVREVITHHYERLDDDPAGRHADPALGGGVLSDLGVYGISLASMLAGPPRGVSTVGTLSGRGVDTSATVSIVHDSARSTVHASMEGPGPNAAAIIGSDGYIALEPFWFSGSGFTVYEASRTGAVVMRRPVPAGESGLHHQAFEVERCLREGLLESPIMTLAETLETTRLREAAVRQLSGARAWSAMSVSDTRR